MTAAPVFVTGTPPASWLDVARGAGLLDREAATAVAFARWHDQVVGVGTTGAARVAAVARGRTLVVKPDAQAELEALARCHDDPLVLADPRACWTLDALRLAAPDAHSIFFIEDPVRALVHWLQAGEGEDPRAALAVWQAGARRLWRHAQQHGASCLLVQADEARADPSALRRAMRDRWGLTPPDTDPSPASADVDPLAWALCEAVVAGDTSSCELYEELLAASEPLTRQDPAEASLAWTRRLDAAAAARRQRELVAAQVALGQAEGRCTAQGSQIDRLQADLAALQQHDQQQRSEHAGELDRIRQQLQLASSESEARQSEIDRLQADLAALQQHDQQQRSEHAGELEGIRQQLQRTRSELSRTRRAAQDAQAEAERLLLRLHQVQGELEHYFVAHQALVDDAGRGPAALASLDIEQLVFGAERTQPPHRQVDVALVKVGYGQRQIDRIDLRLVNHLGRPGILFFGGGGVAPPLSAWQASGQEGERTYRLLIPSDPAGRQALSQLGTTDWGLVVDVVHRLERALRDALPELRDRWLATALRLQAELRHLPARFRYDAVTVEAEDAAPKGALRVTFSQALAGDRVLPRVDLRWWPSPPAGNGGGDPGIPLCLLADPDPCQPPLLGLWPIDDDGRWAATLPLPIGAGLARDDKRRAWAAFGDADRDAVLSLLDALPAAVRAMPDSALRPGITRGALEAAAQRLIDESRRSARPSALWRTARAVRRRLLGR